MASTSANVRYLVPRRVDMHVATQRYFVLGLDKVADLRLEGEPLYTRPFRRPDTKLRALLEASEIFRRSRIRFVQPRPGSGATGRYVAVIDGKQLRFAIDCGDSHHPFDPAALRWSDLYFKANMWPNLEYDPKVRPLINASGLLDDGRIDRLRSLREREKDIDVSFIVNIWGGREHNVRLFEQLAEVDARTELLAVFPPGFDPDETEQLKRRLHAIGVRCTDRQIPLYDLWDVQARSKIVFFRSGKHLCLPWRTVDLLAMGACIVADAIPMPEWYVPLQPGTNFVDCGIARPADTSPAPASEYHGIVPTIDSLLHDEDRMERIRTANARYFDAVAAPEPVAAHILARLREHAAAG